MVLRVASNCCLVGSVPAGSVVGIELSDHAVQLARDFLSERRLDNVEVRQGNAAETGLPRESFDLVTARLVLVEHS